MKDLKELSTEQIQKKIKKTNEKLSINSSLMGAATLIGIILWVCVPFNFLFGFTALAKSCMLVAMLQSFAVTGFMLRVFKLDQKEEELVKELKLREANEQKTKEFQLSFQKETINTASKPKTTTKNKATEEIKDDDFTKGL